MISYTFQAPALYSVLTTLCVSPRQRKLLAAAVMGQAGSAGPPPDIPDGTGGVLPPEVPEEDESEGLNMRRDPWLVCLTCLHWIIRLHSLCQVSSFLTFTGLHVRYQFATAFPTLVGVILFVTGAPLRAFRVLSRLGVSVSYHTTMDRLRTLADDASRRIRALGRLVKDAPPSFLVLWDNVNKQHHAWQTTLSNQVG